jgi:hypothetical protein
MKSASDHAFSRSAFSVDEYIGIGLGRQNRQFKNLFHGLASADDIMNILILINNTS